MTSGVLGLILCPMVDDNLVYSLLKDPEDKHITIVEDGSASSLKRKLDKAGIEYETTEWSDVVGWRYSPVEGAFNILVRTVDLGLHSKPDVLKSTVEEYAVDMQPFVDGIGFYLGTCGSYEWNIPKWCEEKGLKPGAMFCDSNGCLCHDCVGINIAGGPKYSELQKQFTGHLYVFPAMASNFDDFMNADQAETAATEESLTDEMREVLGIEPGRDGYLRWLLSLGDYRHILKIDTGIGERETFDEDVRKVSERTRLAIKDAPEGWADLQPTDDLYSRCKSFLCRRRPSLHRQRAHGWAVES